MAGSHHANAQFGPSEGLKKKLGIRDGNMCDSAQSNFHVLPAMEKT
jgi:hypothetical protein